MENEIKKLQQERTDDLVAIYNNRIPKRVPIQTNLGMHAIAGYAGIDPREVYWDYSLLEQACYEICDTIPADCSPIIPLTFTPPKAQSLYSESSKMGSGGLMQHPNTHMMESDEWDELIADPYRFIVEKAVPRVDRGLDFTAYPAEAACAMHRAIENTNKANTSLMRLMGSLTEKYGFPVMPRGAGGYAPMDILTDELRSFNGILLDLRRHRSKVLDAVDAIAPLNFYHNTPNMATYNRNASVFYPLHMATYMRLKDFEEIWWNSYKREVENYAAMGVRVTAFLETDWTKYTDYLQDLPTGTIFRLEHGDMQRYKDTLGKKHVLTCGYQLGNLVQLSREECVNEAKKLIDIMAPGGQYIFGFDKGPLLYSDVNMDNYKAVVEAVKEYAVYDNPGTACGEVFRQEDFTRRDIPEFRSAAYMTWEKYLEKFPETPERARAIVESTEKDIFNYYYGLLQ